MSNIDGDGTLIHASQDEEAAAPILAGRRDAEVPLTVPVTLPPLTVSSIVIGSVAPT